MFLSINLLLFRIFSILKSLGLYVLLIFVSKVKIFYVLYKIIIFLREFWILKCFKLQS